MRKFYKYVVKHRKIILIFFLMAATACAFIRNLVAVNYDMNDYLPEDAKSTVALDVMEQEFDGGIPNARVMIKNVTIPEALEYKKQLEDVDGVMAVTWLDDAVDITIPLDTLDTATVETYYKDSTALFTVTIEEHSRITAVSAIREIIGNDNAMSGSAVSTATATINTVSEIRKISIIAVIFVLLVLILTTRSWIESFIVLAGLGVAILLNSGTNLIFGEISFVTNAAGSILQLAVSLDYSVFLIHRFEECRMEYPDEKEAMVSALCKSTTSILSSGLTTVIGFLALVLMRFRIGPDLGLALAKGIAISLMLVFVFMPALILAVYQLLDKTRHRPFMPDFRRFGLCVRKMTTIMVCIFAIIIVPAYLASTANAYYYGSSFIFNEETKLGQDIASIENVFGQQDTYVLLVPWGDTAKEKILSNELHDLPEITSIISYVDMAGAEIPLEYPDADTLSQLISENYSRMVLSVDAAYDGDATFALVEQIRDIAEDYYPEEWYLAGEGVSTYDLMDTVTADMVKVNLVAIAAVFFVLLLTMKDMILPIILVLSIETAIWLNLSCPYFMDQRIFYIAYLIISSIQLGATVDYAILMTDRYKENRLTMPKQEALPQTILDVTVSILTSGSALTVVGFLLGYISTNQLLAQLGIFIGRGAVFSLAIVLFILPGLLFLFDRLITKPEKIQFAITKREKHKMKKRKNKKLFSVLLATTLVSTYIPATVFAEGVNTEKEEVVYVSLNTDGIVDEINVVNIFDTSVNSEITDYGSYENVRNMTTTDEINYSGDTIKINSSTGKLYYEGKLDSNTIPWNIQIRYYLNGKELSASHMQGKSGDMKITINITKNTAYQGEFYEKYALQASLLLDTNKCENIEAPDATVANVGSDKQLTYTILPDKGADIEITADATQFEMDGISINGIPLNLNVEVDDEELMEQVTDLIDAIEQLDDGTGQLKDGVEKLQDSVQNDLKSGTDNLATGASQLQNGVGELTDGGSGLVSGAGALESGASALDAGAQSLNTGIAQIQTGLDALNAQSGELTEGSSEMKNALLQLQQALSSVSASTEDLQGLAAASGKIKTGIDELTSGAESLQGQISFEAYKTLMANNGLNIDELQDGNNRAIEAVSDLLGQAEQLEATLTGMGVPSAFIAPLKNQCVSLAGQIVTLLNGNNAAISGMEAYLNGLQEGASDLADGANALNQNYHEFDGAIHDMTNSLTNLLYDMTGLKNAINLLVQEYEKLDSGLGTYTKGVAQVVAGYSQVSTGAAGLAEGSSTLKKGSTSLYDGTLSLLNGLVEVYDATGTLGNGTGQLNEGVAELITGVASLSDGTGELKDGTNELKSETSGMDTEINDKIDDMLSAITGGDFIVSSFASEKNTQIDSVQFVIKTNGIQEPESNDAVIEETQTLTFWQKILNLFGLYKGNE